MLRWTSPLKNMARTITADTEFHGTQLREGEKMMLMFESANFDEAVFGDPDNFNIQRDPNSHLAFGFGTHFCLGNQLARIELINMTRRVLKRLPDLRLAVATPRCRCGRPTSSAAWRRCRWRSPRPSPWAPRASAQRCAIGPISHLALLAEEGQRILKFGARFSLNASGPSLASSDTNTWIPIAVSILKASISCMPSVSWIVLRIA